MKTTPVMPAPHDISQPWTAKARLTPRGALPSILCAANVYLKPKEEMPRIAAQVTFDVKPTKAMPAPPRFSLRLTKLRLQPSTMSAKFRAATVVVNPKMPVPRDQLRERPWQE